MAVTFTVTGPSGSGGVSRNVEGNKRVHRGKLTFSGTYTAGGDTLNASQVGLSTIEQLNLSQLNDAAGNPTTLQAVPVRVSDSQWKIAVACNVVGAVNTATVAAGKTLALTAAETLTNYTLFFEAIGK